MPSASDPRQPIRTRQPVPRPCPAWPASGTADAARSSACRAPGAVLLSFGSTCSADGSTAHCSYGPACRRYPL